MRRTHRIDIAVATAAASLCMLAGCTSTNNPPAPAASTPAAATPASPDPAQVHANEAGEIPVLEFRDVVSGNATDGNISVANFQKDLNWLYAHKWRPIGLSDLVSGKIDVPAGMSPIVLSFEGGLPDQFRILPTGNIDPNCVEAILNAMNNAHSDWGVKGVFFVPADQLAAKDAFGEPKTSSYKIERLGYDGIDVGCALPANIAQMPVKKIQTTLADAYDTIRSSQNPQTSHEVCLTSAEYPKDIGPIKSGSFTVMRKTPIPVDLAHMHKPTFTMKPDTRSYTTDCMAILGDKPSPSPVSPGFDAFRIPMIPISGGTSMEAALKVVTDPFVSDGDPNTIAVPESKKKEVDAQRVQDDALQLKTYP